MLYFQNMNVIFSENSFLYFQNVHLWGRRRRRRRRRRRGKNSHLPTYPSHPPRKKYTRKGSPSLPRISFRAHPRISFRVIVLRPRSMVHSQPLKGINREYIGNIINNTEFSKILDFALYGSWEAPVLCKILPQG